MVNVILKIKAEVFSVKYKTWLLEAQERLEHSKAIRANE